MPAAIKTPRDEIKWQNAKEIVKKEYDLSESDGTKFYRLVMGVYQNSLGKSMDSVKARSSNGKFARHGSRGHFQRAVKLYSKAKNAGLIEGSKESWEAHINHWNVDKLSRFEMLLGKYFKIESSSIPYAMKSNVLAQIKMAISDIYDSLEKSGEHWITTHPNGEEGKGRHILIDGDGNIVGGKVPKQAQGKHISSWWKDSGKTEPKLHTHLRGHGVGFKHYDNIAIEVGEGYKEAKDRFNRPTAARGSLDVFIGDRTPKGYVVLSSNFDDKDKLKGIGAKFGKQLGLSTTNWYMPIDKVPQMLKEFSNAKVSTKVVSAYEDWAKENADSKEVKKLEEIANKQPRTSALSIEEKKQKEEASKAEQQRIEVENKRKESEKLGAEKEANQAKTREEENKKYANMTADEIMKDVDSNMPAWKKRVYAAASWGSTMTDFGEAYKLARKLDTDDFRQAHKEGIVYKDYDYDYDTDRESWFVNPYQYPEIYYKKRKEEQKAKDAVNKIRQEKISKISNIFREKSTYPKPDENKLLDMPEGEEYVENKFTIYGGGSKYVVDKKDNKIWHIRNNGGDGDNWSYDNIRTGGAGAIGTHMPYTKEIEDQIKEVFGEVSKSLYSEKLNAINGILKKAKERWITVGGKGRHSPTISTETVYQYLIQNYPASTLKWVEGCEWRLSKNVPLSQILMSRRPGGRNFDKVKGIAQAIRDGKKMEPIVLVETSQGFKVADGYHRLLAFKHVGRKSIAAYVGVGGADDGPFDEEMHDKKLNKSQDPQRQLLEKISSQIHIAWARWFKGVAKELTPAHRKGGEKLYVPYSKLPEDEKDKDREHAEKIVNILEREKDQGNQDNNEATDKLKSTVKDGLKDEKEGAEYYSKLIKMPLTDEEKEQIKNVKDDENQHHKILASIFKRIEKLKAVESK